MPEVHDSKRGYGRRAVSLFSCRGIGAVPRGDRRGEEDDHARVKQLSRAYQPSEGEGSRHRGREEVRHRLRGHTLPQRHPRHPCATRGEACLVLSQGRGAHLFHRIPNQPRDHNIPCRQARRGRDRQARPRQHHRRVQAILCRGQKVQAQRYGKP